jgi:hypothetical protein
MTASLASSARRMRAGPAKLDRNQVGRNTSLGADLIMAKSVVLLLEVHAAGYWMDIAK